MNFNRPAFTRLLEDIDNGRVNLVITKDLSRLGRDYIQTGYYTDVYFSRKRVRYIAVNDGIDTARDDNDIAPFKNILNDMYAKDLSRKVKSAKLVLCQEKVQIKCNQFSLFLAKFNLQSLLHSFRAFRDIVPRIQLETNIHNDCECVLYCKMFRCIQKSIYMHACS